MKGSTNTNETPHHRRGPRPYRDAPAGACCGACRPGGGRRAGRLPREVFVGDTFTASIELRNDNSGPAAGATNTVCNPGDAPPCPADNPGATVIIRRQAWVHTQI
jgi:hypothetical protein